MSTTHSSRSSSSVTATRPATRSSSPTSKAKSSPSTPDPLPASATSATADAPEPAPGTRQCHRSPDTPTVTDVQMQNCHPCPETSHSTRVPSGLCVELMFEYDTALPRAQQARPSGVQSTNGATTEAV